MENFLLDGALLSLSLYALKVPVRLGRVAFAAAIGGVFAVLFPLLRLSKLSLSLLKSGVGALLPLLSFGRIKTGKEWGRYALSLLFFFGLTFLFGGVLLGGGMGLFQNRVPFLSVGLAFLILSVFVILGVKGVYRRRKRVESLYACVVEGEGKRKRVTGFLDSGNLAKRQGIPVCFLSPDILWELYGEWILEGEERGQVCDEIKITTMAGEKKLSLYRGAVYVEVQGKPIKKEVYFARLANRIDQEYKLILQAELIGE